LVKDLYNSIGLWFGEQIMQVVSNEVNFKHLILSSVDDIMNSFGRHIQ